MSQQKSTKGGIPQYNDSQRLINRSNSEKIYKRFDELKNEGMPQQKSAKGVCPSMMTLKDQEIDRVVRKSATIS